MRETYYEDSSFLFQYRILEGVVFLHCTVFEWKLSTLKKQISILSEFLNVMKKKGFDAVYTITPNPRFARLLGGEYIGDYSEEDFEYEVFKWELKQ